MSRKGKGTHIGGAQPKGRNPKGLQADYNTSMFLFEVMIFGLIVFVGVLAIIRGDL